MAYLYLNFLDNLDKGLGDKAWGRNDFFTQSLNEQYEALKRKLGGYAPDTFQEFIGYTFPSTPKYYNVSLPSFDRVMDENKRGNKILRNIVIFSLRSARNIRFYGNRRRYIWERYGNIRKRDRFDRQTNGKIRRKASFLFVALCVCKEGNI